jgi:hypothetical protein
MKQAVATDFAIVFSAEERDEIEIRTNYLLNLKQIILEKSKLCFHINKGNVFGYLNSTEAQQKGFELFQVSFCTKKIYCFVFHGNSFIKNEEIMLHVMLHNQY